MENFFHTLDMESANFRYEYENLKFEGAILDRILNMYNYVKRYGIDRSFLSLYNRDHQIDNFVGVRFPACEDMDSVGNPRSPWSIRFIMAMEDDAPAANAGGGGDQAQAAAPTDNQAAEQGNKPAANKGKANGFFAKIIAFVKRCVGNIIRFIKKVFKKAAAFILGFQGNVDKYLQALGNETKIDVDVLNYKDVTQRAKMLDHVLRRIVEAVQNNNNAVDSSGNVNISTNTNIAREAVIQARAELDKVMEDIKVKGAGEQIAGNQHKIPWVSNTVTEMRNCIDIIVHMQKEAQSLMSLIEEKTTQINSKIESIQNDPSKQKLIPGYKVQLQLYIDMCSIVEKLTKWNGDSVRNINHDIMAAFNKAKGGGAGNPAEEANANAEAAAANDNNAAPNK